MRFASTFFVTAFLASVTSASVISGRNNGGGGGNGGSGGHPHGSGCAVDGAVLSLPSGQTTLLAPTDGSKPISITLGSGVQNYTCGPAGNYTSAGAVAELYDISCLYGSWNFDRLTSIVLYNRPKYESVSETLFHELRMAMIIRGEAQHVSNHYFVPNPSGTGIAPKFEFIAPASLAGEFVIGTKLAGLAAEDKAHDVDLLELGNVQGSLAKYVYRVSTKGGQPPKTCTPGDTTSVPYAAQYWFFK